jgi:hypothetical protein
VELISNFVTLSLSLLAASTPRICGNYNVKYHVINTTNLIPLHFHFQFIKVQSLDMFRALLDHLQEALHERRIGGYCVRYRCGLVSGCGKTGWVPEPD